MPADPKVSFDPLVTADSGVRRRMWGAAETWKAVQKRSAARYPVSRCLAR